MPNVAAEPSSSPRPLAPSALRQSAWTRLGIVAVPVAVLWLLVVLTLAL